MKIRDIELFGDEVMKVINEQEYIGIRMSGGIDSAILCAVVLRFFPHIKLLPISLFNEIRPGARQSVANLLEKLKELYPDNKLMPVVSGTFDSTGFTGQAVVNGVKISPKDVFQRHFIRDMFKEHNGKLNLLLSGETLNPPLEDQQMLGMVGQFLQYRDEKVVYPLDEYKMSPNETKYEYRPFRNYNKKQVRDVGEELGVLSSIFSITETCESTQSNYDRYSENYGMIYENPGHDPCQYCWPCVEKYWAYGLFDFDTPLKRKLP
jgi:tRNA(Ile)-lysidine synthase TilS/MesJ